MTIPAKQTLGGLVSATTIEDIITKGDLSKLTSEQRSEYYIKLCQQFSLSPLTQPFDWLVLNGKLTLYANRRCADQLRKVNGININIISQEFSDGLLTIHVKAKDSSGREDEDLGVVGLPDTLKGEARANTILKCVTKAKRRVTLSISGLGFLDETEVEDIPAQAKRENPHVTTPTDIIGDPIEYDEHGNPVDNIPLGDPSIEKLRVKDARPEYALLASEIRKITSLKVLEEWGKANANRVASLSNNWQEILRGEYREKMVELGWKPGLSKRTIESVADDDTSKWKDAGEPREITLGDSPDWRWFGSLMIEMASQPNWKDWDEANRNNHARMQNEDPKNFDLMIAGIKEARAKNVHLRSRN